MAQQDWKFRLCWDGSMALEVAGLCREGLGSVQGGWGWFGWIGPALLAPVPTSIEHSAFPCCSSGVPSAFPALPATAVTTLTRAVLEGSKLLQGLKLLEGARVWRWIPLCRTSSAQGAAATCDVS